MRRSLTIALFLLLSLFTSTSFASEVALFGPNEYLRTKGQPNVYTETFLGITGIGKLLINTGDADGRNRGDIASILVNGVQVIAPTAFARNVNTIEAPVNLARNNSIIIKLLGAPGNHLTITVTEEIVCTAIDQCHVAGTWDRTLGQCSNPAAANGTACNDGNVCTQTDTCQAGVCVGSNPLFCAATDQCHTAGVCDPVTGCSNPAKPNGTACNDGNVCTQWDWCQAGVCVGKNPVVCTASDECHIAGCDPTVGCVETDQRTVVLNISETVQRFSWWKPDGRVELYDMDYCQPWTGSYSQNVNEPPEKINYCGPTAGMNLLYWYTGPSVPYDTYYQLGSEMHTNDWMSFGDALSVCYCACSLDPWCFFPDPLCEATCPTLVSTFNVGTHPDDMENTLRKHSLLESSVGYLLFRHQGNPGLEALEYCLAQGNPVVVLIWTGKTLHWTTVIGTTYDQNGTVMVRFANHNDQTWDWFVHEWSFEGLNWPVPGLLSDFGLKNYVWMYYEKTTILRSDYGAGFWIGEDNGIISADGRFRLVLQDDSNLCLRKIENDEGIWCSGTNGSGAQVVWMQSNGNLVMRNSDNAVVWSSNSYVGPGGSYYLAIQNDGNLVIYNAADNKAIWETDTCCH